MRISDWSSDVCSSDLGMSCPVSTSSPLGSLRNVFVENALERVVLVGVVDEAVLPAAPDDGCPGAAEDADGMGVVFSSGSGTVVEIGRASCRGRVCTYG